MITLEFRKCFEDGHWILGHRRALSMQSPENMESRLKALVGRIGTKSSGFVLRVTEETEKTNHFKIREGPNDSGDFIIEDGSDGHNYVIALPDADLARLYTLMTQEYPGDYQFISEENETTCYSELNINI